MAGATSPATSAPSPLAPVPFKSTKTLRQESSSTQSAQVSTESATRLAQFMELMAEHRRLVGEVEEKSETLMAVREDSKKEQILEAVSEIGKEVKGFAIELG